MYTYNDTLTFVDKIYVKSMNIENWPLHGVGRKKSNAKIEIFINKIDSNLICYLKVHVIYRWVHGIIFKSSY